MTNFSIKSVTKTLILCAVNMRTHHRRGTEDHHTDQASGCQHGPSLSIEHSLDFSSQTCSSQEPQQPSPSLLCHGKGLQGGEAQTASVRMG